MGVVDFDPDKWSRALEAQASGTVAKVAKLAKGECNPSELSQLSRLSQVAPLPDEVRHGLTRLKSSPVPHSVRAEHWPAVVADALRLAHDGWAAHALALGWTELDLFGAVTDGDGDPEADGLAVKLAGRKVLAISENFMTVQDGESGRAYLYRRGSEGARLLWELGHGNTLSGRIPH